MASRLPQCSRRRLPSSYGIEHGAARRSERPPVADPVVVAGSVGLGGWYTSAVTVDWRWSDAGGSGIDPAACVTTSASVGEGALSLSATCRDQVGNVASATYDVKVDATPPALAPVFDPYPVVLGGVATVSANASDAVSGLASASCGAVDTETLGSKTVTCEAADVAGIVAFVEVPYAVYFPYSGFGRPVDDDVVNEVRAGRGVPLRFSLGAYHGLDVLAQGSPSSQSDVPLPLGVALALRGTVPRAWSRGTVSVVGRSLGSGVSGTGIRWVVRLREPILTPGERPGAPPDRDQVDAGGSGRRRAPSRGVERQQHEGVDVAWAHRPEVAPIEGRQLRLGTSFGDGEHGCVDEADVRVCVAIAELADASVVGSREVIDLDRTGVEVIEQCDPGARSKPLLRPVLHLDEDRGRHHELLVGGLEQPSARRVVGVVAVEGGVEGASIEDQCHWRSSGRSSLARRAVSS